MRHVPITARRIRALSAPALGRLRFTSLAVIGALLAHDAIFAAQFGLGAEHEAALRNTAHGYWPAFTALTLLAGAVVAGGTASVLLQLRRLLRGLPRVTDPARPPWSAEVRSLWPRLFGVVTLAFLVQENLEHVASGHAFPGLWVLSAPGYPLAIPVLVVVTGLLAAAGGWIRWQQATMLRRLRAARAAARRHPVRADHPHGRWTLLAALLAHRWLLVRGHAGRGPPVAATA